MQRFLALCLMLLATLVSNPLAARSFTTGDSTLRPSWWHDPSMPGFGVTLSPAGKMLAGTVLTFDQAGESTWYLVVGNGDGTRWTLPVTRHTASNTAGTVVGSFTFEVVDTRHARASYVIDGAAKTVDLVPLELAPGYSAEDRSGHWADPAENGHGYTVYSQGKFLSVVHYGYDAAGNPRWVYADNGGDPKKTRLDATYFRRPCATCNATALPAGTIEASFPLETAGKVKLDLALPAPLSGGFVRAARPVTLLTDLPSGRRTAASLAHFLDDTTLTDYLREATSISGGTSYDLCPIDFSPVPVGTSTVSRTNTQETDVDEADLIESDGEYVYAVAPGGYREDGTIAAAQLRTLRIGTGGGTPDATPLSELRLAGGGERDEIDGLYLVEGTASAPARLAVVYSTGGYYCGNASAAKSTLEVYALTDRARPTLIDTVKLDGVLMASRRIGRRVVLVSQFFPAVDGLEYPYGADGLISATVQRNAARVAGAGLAELSAELTVNGTARPLFTAATTWLPPFPREERGDRITTVTALPIDAPAQAASVSVVTATDMVYASTTSVWLTTSRYDAPPGPSLLPGDFQTDIHRIALSDVSYRASGTIAGMPAASEQAFALSEHAGHLRVLHNTAVLGQQPRQQLSILRENAATRTLVETGRIPNAQRPEPIGKPGESAYGVRYAGERAYAVTFRRIDPLYVLDLSDPADPRIVGEVELPGFSTYLHPIGTDKLLGIGMAPDNTNTTQLSLFRIAADGTPSVLTQRNLGAYSMAQYDHRAFASVTLADGTFRFTVPSNEYRDSPGGPPYIRFGLAMFEVSGDTLQPRGNVLQRETENGRFRPLMRGWQRGLIAGDAVYGYLDGELVGAPWGRPDLRSPPR